MPRGETKNVVEAELGRCAVRGIRRRRLRLSGLQSSCDDGNVVGWMVRERRALLHWEMMLWGIVRELVDHWQHADDVQSRL